MNQVPTTLTDDATLVTGETFALHFRMHYTLSQAILTKTSRRTIIMALRSSASFLRPRLLLLTSE